MLVIGSKIILKGVVLAAAATPLFSTASIEPSLLSANKSNAATLSSKSLENLFGGQRPRGSAPSDSYKVSRNFPREQQSMTNIPKSYNVYLLYRSDGTLIGPSGIVPLEKNAPQVTPIAPLAGKAIGK